MACGHKLSIAVKLFSSDKNQTRDFRETNEYIQSKSELVYRTCRYRMELDKIERKIMEGAFKPEDETQMKNRVRMINEKFFQLDRTHNPPVCGVARSVNKAVAPQVIKARSCMLC